MQEIYRGLKKASYESRFADAIYGLYHEFADGHRAEWDRLAANEKMYAGDHWDGAETNEPRPSTPVIFSTVENIRADLNDEFPEAVIKPEGIQDEGLAKVLSRVVEQTLEACDFDAEYGKLTHDLLVGGYCIWEAGFDASLNYGLGGGFIRHVPNNNILLDPLCADIQDGRAIFKLERYPKEWFEQRYPKEYLQMKGDITMTDPDHFRASMVDDKRDEGYYILLEAWFKVFDRGKTKVHCVQLAGGVVLENSCEVKPDGYFLHGQYPFVVTPLYKQKGSPRGLGVVDMFGLTQKYADKLDQILLKNALTSGRNRLLVQEGSVNDIEDLADFSKEIVEVQNLGGITWFQDRPLPSYILNYMLEKRNTIKEESGSNDFSRGNVSAGVTAASAITALQEMSSKRSRMEARCIHYGFKQAVRMLIEVLREFEVYDREIQITVNGEPIKVIANKFLYASLDFAPLPIEFSISIKPVRETKFTKLSNNQLILEFCSMFQGQLDPVILMEAMDFQGQELVLEKMRSAQSQGMAALTKENEQLKSSLMQVAQDYEGLKEAFASQAGALQSVNLASPAITGE